MAFHTAEDDRIDAIAARAPITYGRAFDSYRSQVEINTADEPGEDAPSGGWTDFFADPDKYSSEATADALSADCPKSRASVGSGSASGIFTPWESRSFLVSTGA